MSLLPNARFGRVLTAMVTPFDDQGRLDLKSAQQLAQWLLDQGNDGLVLNGTTGESPTLTAEESLDLFRAVREATDAPLIAGTGSNDTAHAIKMTKAATAIGVDGVMLVAPYYNKPSQAGLERHFRMVAEATDLPVILYDIPGRTGRKVETSTILTLAHAVPNLIGLKDAAGNPGETGRVAAGAPEGFQIYSGDDAQTLPLLAIGAVGVISVAGHWCARAFGKMIAAFDGGDLARARRLNAALLPSFRFETSDDAPNPVPSKAMLRTLGQPVGHCRPPMGPTPDGLEDEARRVYAALQDATAAGL